MVLMICQFLLSFWHSFCCSSLSFRKTKVASMLVHSPPFINLYVVCFINKGYKALDKTIKSYKQTNFLSKTFGVLFACLFSRFKTSWWSTKPLTCTLPNVFSGRVHSISLCLKSALPAGLVWTCTQPSGSFHSSQRQAKSSDLCLCALLCVLEMKESYSGRQVRGQLKCSLSWWKQKQLSFFWSKMSSGFLLTVSQLIISVWQTCLGNWRDTPTLSHHLSQNISC